MAGDLLIRIEPGRQLIRPFAKAAGIKMLKSYFRPNLLLYCMTGRTGFQRMPQQTCRSFCILFPAGRPEATRATL